MERVRILRHPLVSFHLAVLRDKKTSAHFFRNSALEISALLILEAIRNLPLKMVQVQTPLASTEIETLDERKTIFAVAILRAGLIMTEVAARLIPGVILQHLGMYRQEKTLEPICYYNRLPEKFQKPEDTWVYICDPMLATGGTATEVIQLYLQRGVAAARIKFISIISAPEGIRKILTISPHLEVITASVDERLNDQGYIVPGLGDAGDRLFNTSY
jgi:uracil phosphoribosyltransferase